MAVIASQPSIPFRENIDISTFLKSTSKSEIISVEDNIRGHLKNNKKYNTLLEIQEYSKWGEPYGIKPRKAYDFQKMLDLIEKNPDEEFTRSDVWVPTDKIVIFTKFNRKPDVSRCIAHLNVDLNKNRFGLNWQALDTPHYYLVMIDGVIYLMSSIGGHRATMCVLSNGFNSQMPCRVTYIGTLDKQEVQDACAKTHHTDSDKRANQVAGDRLASGVEAGDERFIKHMTDLLACRLYADVDKIDVKKAKDMRKITSWQGHAGIVKNFGIENAKYASDKIREYEKKPEPILSQAVETIACFRWNFIDEQNIDIAKRHFDKFLDWYFTNFNTQSDLKSEGKIGADVIYLVERFNRWSKGQNWFKQGSNNPITNKHTMKAFGESVKITG